jgi:enoyl-CoA hydratase
MTKTQVQTNIDGSHATITFGTEEGLNVLSTDGLYALGAAIAKVRKDPLVRTTVLQAKGKVFVAGADIKEMSGFKPDQAHEYATLGQTVMNDIASLPSITVAAMQGAALGGGLEVALACDFRIAVKSAKLGLPEVTLGLIPGWGGVVRLNQLIGTSRAKRMYLSANPVSGEDALGSGLVDEIVNSPEDMVHRIAAFCKSFQRASPVAVALAKRAARDHDETGAFVECFRNKDSREGMAAFAEKRLASWME